ncbi:MAG: methionyl-tRNA formyltransferase [Planctomyces sp.]
MALRVVLMGTGEFALPTFRTLMNSSHQVVGVFTQPDKTGRGHHRHVNAVKELGIENSVPVFQPERVNRPAVLDELRSLSADVFVVAAYGQILRPELLSIPRLGAFNLHGSLLPRHRGAAPVQYSIWKGDRETGVTMFQIEPALDSGPIVGRVVTEIGPRETSGELMLRLADLSVALTAEVLQKLESGTAAFLVQDESLVTLAPKIDKTEGSIDWKQTAEQIDCHIRAMQPWPKAVTSLLRDELPPIRCVILEATPIDGSSDPSFGTGSSVDAGRIEVVAGQLTVQTGSGRMVINSIQPDGRRLMDGRSFLNGYPLTSSSRFGIVTAD